MYYSKEFSFERKSVKKPFRFFHYSSIVNFCFEQDLVNYNGKDIIGNFVIKGVLSRPWVVTEPYDDRTVIQ